MGTEKIGAKGGGFFHLFDWNKKSRKKLFANGAVSPEGAKQGKKFDNNMRMTHLCLIDGDEIAGLSSNKGSSEHSCASSVTYEDGNGIRAPGVVARLMGLDSMPTSGASELYSTPLFDSKSLRERRYQKGNFESNVNNQYNGLPCRADDYCRKPTESRSQKMPSSPIEKFQREMLPPKSAKSLSLTHYKLLSPIKNPRFISAENAAHIMEAAAKIIEPRFQTNANNRVLLRGSSSVPLKVHDSLGSMAASQKTSRFQETSSSPMVSNAVHFLGGQRSTKSWNVVEDDTNTVTPPNCDETNSIGTMGKGKSISLAIQAKVNVQRREGLSTSSRSTLIQTNQDQFRRNQPLKNQSNAQKNKSQKRASALGSSSVLKQNNQKQNCLTNKDKLPSKPSVPNQQGRKVLPGGNSSGTKKTSNRLSVNPRVGYRKEDMQSTVSEKEGSSSKTKILSRKKRLLNGELDSDKCGFTGDIVTGRHEKRAQPNVVIDEHLKWGEDSRRNGMDVVSFTFTSPMRKTVPDTQSSTKTLEKQDKKDDYFSNTLLENNAIDMKSKKLPSIGSNVLSGGALSSFLEQTLRELNSGFEPSYSNLVKAGAASTSGLRVSETNLQTLSPSAEHCREFSFGSEQNSLGSVSESISSMTSDQVSHVRHKLQGVEDVECSNSSDAHKRPDPQRQSPLSVLDASYSNESCCSSETCNSNNGTKMWSSAQVQNTAGLNCINKLPLVKEEIELSDSASSSVVDTVYREHVSEVSTTGYTETYEWDIDYIKEIVRNINVNVDLALGHGSETLDPLLFDMLENERKKFRSENGDRAIRERRRLLFDCVSDCLNVKSNCYFRAGYQKWAKGVALVRKEEFSEELYKEIMGWRSMEDCMVDELVGKDMSSHLGRWVDYDNEAFEIGGEIEMGVLSCLIDEVVSDYLV